MEKTFPLISHGLVDSAGRSAKEPTTSILARPSPVHDVKTLSAILSLALPPQTLLHSFIIVHCGGILH